jgi:hypothetical protein
MTSIIFNSSEDVQLLTWPHGLQLGPGALSNAGDFRRIDADSDRESAAKFLYESEDATSAWVR